MGTAEIDQLQKQAIHNTSRYSVKVLTVEGLYFPPPRVWVAVSPKALR